jgi:hypothetical protein
MDNRPNQTSPPTGSDSRQPYEKPTIVHRERLESIAGDCQTTHQVNGKTGEGDNCTFIGS